MYLVRNCGRRRPSLSNMESWIPDPPRNKQKYWDKQTYSTYEDHLEAMKVATTIYVGNLSFYTTEWQVHELFQRIGPIRRIVMGLDRFKKTPCGFCFVEYETHKHAVQAVDFISGTKLDGRSIRCEMDGGFKEGRQYGRGQSGGQVRDERRSKEDYDAGRGGYGRGDNYRPFRRDKRGEGEITTEVAPVLKEESNPRFRTESKDEDDEDS